MHRELNGRQGIFDFVRQPPRDFAPRCDLLGFEAFAPVFHEVLRHLVNDSINTPTSSSLSLECVLQVVARHFPRAFQQGVKRLRDSKANANADHACQNDYAGRGDEKGEQKGRSQIACRHFDVLVSTHGISNRDECIERMQRDQCPLRVGKHEGELELIGRHFGDHRAVREIHFDLFHGRDPQGQILQPGSCKRGAYGFAVAVRRRGQEMPIS